ncbi:hypothetical protein HQ560_18380, partial [bacterium]|nr:hypothetical protein [bacterium]
PILQWAHGDHGWMGGARFATKRKIASHAFTIVRDGPACIEYEARYRFAPKGEYVWRVRLSPLMPIAVVTEEFDVGETTDGHDLLLLDLHKGWTPGRTGWVASGGENNMARFPSSDYAAFVASKRKATSEAPPVGGVGEAPKPFRPEPGMTLLSRTVPGGKWGGYAGGIAVWDGEPGTGRTLGFMPLHTGSWRRTLALDTWHTDKTGMTVALPLSVRPIRWSLDIADDFSPFSTHEHDEGLSPTYGRRCWGFFVGSRMAEARARYGYIGLDRYKDWTLEWPDTAGAKAYPGGFFSPAHVERLRKALDRHPDGAYLRSSWYLFSGDVQHAVQHAEKVIALLKKPTGENNLFLVGLSNYRKSQFYAFANLAEDALACAELPDALRSELRRRLALYAYTMSDPDLNPRGAGVHLGNNNMTINRTLALTYFAGLLPDHPRTPYWLDRAGAYARFKFATQTAPCGSWVACPSYQLYSPTRTLNITQNILRNRGVEDFSKLGYHGSTLRYLANLTVPDPRFDGLRIIPGMGNSTNLVENVWGFGMAAVADRDPKLAGWLRFINRLANRDRPLEPGPNSHDKNVPHPLYYLPDIPENREPLQTAFFPAYGVVFRSHFGSPDETTLLFRAGMNWSHWDTDALNVVLYGRGAPLSPGTGYQYYSGPMGQNNAVYHNRVKVGRRDLPEVFGRVDAAIADYGFGPSADYAVADRYYPPELFRDGQGDMHWRRHVLFLKGDRPDSPTAFVLRDTFPNGESRRKWWTWMNLGQADRVAVDGAAFEAAPVNQVVAEANMPTRRGQTMRMRTDFAASTWFWLAEPRDIRIRMVAEYGRHDGKGKTETKTIVEIPAGPKQDFFYAVAPVREGEATPTCKALADGVMS